MTLRDSYLAGDDGVREEDRLPGEGNLPGESEALARDANDPLSRYRDLFLLPDEAHVPAVRLLRAAAILVGQRHLALQPRLFLGRRRRRRRGLLLFLLRAPERNDDDEERSGTNRLSHVSHPSLRGRLRSVRL